ncbi:MAG: hypothetical protein Q7R88_02050 [bacterium]|nr:hypothetical protein [bacterium]
MKTHAPPPRPDSKQLYLVPRDALLVFISRTGATITLNGEKRPSGEMHILLNSPEADGLLVKGRRSARFACRLGRRHVDLVPPNEGVYYTVLDDPEVLFAT